MTHDSAALNTQLVWASYRESTRQLNVRVDGVLERAERMDPLMGDRLVPTHRRAQFLAHLETLEGDQQATGASASAASVGASAAISASALIVVRVTDYLETHPPLSDPIAMLAHAVEAVVGVVPVDPCEHLRALIVLGPTRSLVERRAADALHKPVVVHDVWADESAAPAAANATDSVYVEAMARVRRHMRRYVALTAGMCGDPATTAALRVGRLALLAASVAARRKR